MTRDDQEPPIHTETTKGRGRPAIGPATDTVGFRLRATRLRVGAEQGAMLSQAGFAHGIAARLGTPFHQTRLSRLESNEVEPTLAELLACADLGGVSVTWLAYGFATTGDEPDTRGAWLAQYRHASSDERTRDDE